MLDNTLLINEELFFKFFEGNYRGIVTLDLTDTLERSISDLANLVMGIKCV